MNMIHLLATYPSSVHDGSKPVVTPLLLGQLPRNGHYFSHHGNVFFSGISQRGNVLFRNNQKVHWRSWLDVVKREDILVFVYFSARDFPSDNFAENAV